MYRLVKLTALASALTFAGLAASPFAVAKDNEQRPCFDCVPGGGGGPFLQNGQDQGFPGRRVKRFEPPDNQGGEGPYIPRKRAKAFELGDQYQLGGDDNAVEKRTRRSKPAWTFDSNRHDRRRHKDKRFQYYLDGFWYPRAYWDEPYYYDDYIVPSRLSCRAGAGIVSERFNRVRIIECDGRVYTYVGRRHGDMFEIKLNARTGRIIDAEEI